MSSDRFEEAKRIYNSALERTPAERDAYLAEACGTDASLREEIESLLGYRSQAEAFFEVPASQAVDLAGCAISHYDVIEKIGEGGMGVVYKARDRRLDRFVALKFLPPALVVDDDRKRRFLGEARTASALNHPNIVTVYDIGAEGGVAFIAMEYVQGKTLDLRIRDRSMSLADILRCGIEAAGALAAAHRAGIVHRDIKPGNIMVDGAGQTKILDFGLAKLAGGSNGVVADGPVTGETEEGLLVGTIAYMSPEQANRQVVDARSDIFSLGAVLYELTTGCRAFQGETKASTLAAIRHGEPAPVSQVSPDTPAEFAEIIDRCLRRDAAKRFQDAAGLRAALVAVDEQRRTATAGAQPRRLARIGWIAFVATLLGGGWFALVRGPATGPSGVVSLLSARVGMQTHPALSSDGRQVAFVWNGEKQDNFDIYVQAVDETSARRLTSSPAFDYGPAWAPDARRIAFERETPTGTQVVLIPAAGGTERVAHVSAANCQATPRPMTKQLCGVAWSPNGRFLAIVDRLSPGGSNSIFLLNVDTGAQRNLTTPARGTDDGLAAFSPDGRTLAFARRHGLPLSDIYVLPISENGEPRGEPRQVTRDNTFIAGLDWTPEGRYIVFASSRGGVMSLWRVAKSGGAPERLPFGGETAAWPSVSRTGNRLAYSSGSTDQNVWRVAAPGRPGVQPLEPPVRITQSPLIDQDAVFSPEGGRIAWTSMHSGSHQVWVCRSDGSTPFRLTDLDPPGADAPQWSPDGRQIAFRGFVQSGTRVFVVAVDAGLPHPLRLTAGDFSEGPPIWSHDGKWVYFASRRGQADGIWKVPASGGSPILVGPGGRDPVESGDGASVYFQGQDAGIWKAPSNGGTPVLLAPSGSAPVESVDGKFLYYYGPDASVWRISVAGGDAVQVQKIGPRARWTVARSGIYLLDPDTKGGPAIERLSHSADRRDTVGLPGEPMAYTIPGNRLIVSPDERWVLYHRIDRTQVDLMLVKGFR